VVPEEMIKMTRAAGRTGCSNQAYSLIVVRNNAFEFQVQACHRCHDKITAKSNTTVMVVSQRLLTPEEKCYDQVRQLRTRH
jgi:hypothetical protein